MKHLPFRHCSLFCIILYHPHLVLLRFSMGWYERTICPALCVMPWCWRFVTKIENIVGDNAHCSVCPPVWRLYDEATDFITPTERWKLSRKRPCHGAVLTSSEMSTQLVDWNKRPVGQCVHDACKLTWYTHLPHPTTVGCGMWWVRVEWEGVEILHALHALLIFSHQCWVTFHVLPLSIFSTLS